MPVLYANNAASRLAASITNVATSFSVTAGHGAKFPAISGGDYFYATLMDTAGNLEIVKVTARATDTFTVARAQEGTTARAYAVNDIVELRITKLMLDDFKTDTRAGNAATATALQTARTINGVSFNGTANITVADSTKLPLSGGTLTGPLIFGNATSPNTQTIQFGDNTGWTLRYMTSVSGTLTERFRFVDNGAFNAVGAITQNGSQVLHAGNYNSYSPTLTGTGASGSWGISVTGSSASTTGNAATATALQTARTIGGVSFNGTANINLPGVNTAGNQNTTGSAATLTTARTLTIGSTGKTFNGSANVAWSLAEIGALGASAKAADSELLDGYNSDRFLRTYADSSMEAGVHGGNLNGTNMQYLLAREQVQNLVAYVAPTSYETWNGSAWVSATVPTAIFRNKPSNNFGGLTIANGVTKVRFTWVGFGYKFWSTLATAGSTNGNSFRARIYTSSDNVTWVERFVSGYVTDWPGYHVWPTYYGDAAFPHMRIELEFTYVNANTCTFGDIALWGAYGGYTPLFDWDYSRNITFGGGLQLGGDLQLLDKFLRFDQAGTRSWTARATGGNLDIASGDSAGLLRYNSNTILHAGNFSSYAPSLSGSYADPAWVTSLASSKLTGTIDNARLNGGTYTINVSGSSGSTTGNAASATRLINLRTINGVGFDGTANITVADSTKLPLSGGTLTGALYGNGGVYSNGIIEAQGQLRASGWWGTSSGAYSGLAVEVGVSGGVGVILTYNRNTGTWGTLNLQGASSNLQIGTAVNVSSGALQQGGNQVLHAGNVSSYALPIGGGTLTGAINVGSSGNTRSSLNTNGDFYSFYSTETSARIQLGRDIGVSGGAGLALGGSSYALIGTADTTGSALYIKLSATVATVSTSPSFQFTSAGFYVGSNQALHAGNYTSYSPSLTGSGASGSWGISVTGSSASTTGNAATATVLQTARTIALTGDVTGSVSFNGSANVSIAAVVADDSHDHTYVKSSGSLAAETLRATHKTAGIYTFNSGNLSLGDSTPVGYWSTLAWGAGAGGSAELAVNWTGNGNEIWFRSLRDTTDNWYAWKELIHSANYTDYTVTKTGTGASGSWGISVTGSAATLTTARTLWGQSFNGSANVTGALSSVTTLAMSGQLTNTVAVGTAPFVITSTTRVANLNVATAGTADTLTTARTINGTSFNGSANITTANWGTARTLTIGSTGKSVDGSANVAWTLAEIGAAAASHTHSYLPTSGGTLTSSGSSTTLHISDTGVNGANIKLTGDGATTPSKFIRVKSGLLEIINNAYTAPILQLSDAGNLSVSQINGGVPLTNANYSSYGITRTTGSPAYYGARAWVNFNGTGTVAIRASSNVSSITDNGVGLYAINFSTAMPDTNYSAAMSITGAHTGEASRTAVVLGSTSTGASAKYTTSLGILTGYGWANGTQDNAEVNVIILR